MSYPVAEENFPRVRRLPFQDNIHTSIFTPREYQVELLDAARRRNLTACLGNSPSKAFVSVMLIREIAHEIRHTAENKSKWIVVIFSTVHVIQQYAEKIRDHTDLLVGEFIDSVELDDWSKELQNKQVLVMTVQLFIHLLSKQVIQLPDVILIIIGESHQAAKLEHPIRKLMDILKQSDSQTRLLGLSASIMKNQCDEPHLLEMYMNRLERTMGGVAETTSDMVSLSRFGNRFNELVVECIEKDNSLNYDISNDCLTLDKKIRNIAEPAFEFIMDHVYRPEEIYGNIDEDLNIPDPKIIPKFYLNELLHILSTLGPWCADRAALRFLKELKKHKDDTPYERHYLLISMVYTVMDMVHAICDYHFRDMIEVEKILKYSSPKVLRLLEILKHFKPLDSSIAPIHCRNNDSKGDGPILCYNSLEPNKDLIGTKNDDSNKTDTSELSTHVNKITLQDVKDDMKSLINLVSDTVTNSENTLYSSCQIIAKDSLADDTVRQKNLKNEQLENTIINNLQSTRRTHTPFTYHRVNNEVQKEKITSSNKHDNYTSGNKRDYGNRNRMLTVNINVDDPNSLCGLVFVDKRNTACIMHLLLKELSRHHDDFRFIAPNFLVGHTKSPYQQTQQHNENREVMLEHRKQEEVLRRFRLRECNLLVATNVLQDGIDIPKCNLVVRFDLPKDYRSYVQCKGRARATTSHLIHLVEKSEKTKFIDDLARFKTVEEILLNRCHEREIPTDEEVNLKEADFILAPYCPSNKENAAKVTMSTAISLVNRYCAKLPSDTFTRLTPCCQLIEKKIDDKTFYQALLFLPINSPVKHPVIVSRYSYIS